ncbi:MAG TPA: YCF48-related protein [Terriglobales bacterium]
MPELSKLVRQRLASLDKAGVVAGDHPDADTLTAYAEQLLSPIECSRVLEHIAACSHCREVVALGSPEPAEKQPVPALVTSRHTWRWKPALGLAASVAMLAVVTTLIVELPRKPALQSAKQSTAPANPRAQDTLNAPPNPAQPEYAAGPNTQADEPRAAASRSAEPRTKESGAPSAINGIVGGNPVLGRNDSLASPAPPAPLRADVVSSASDSAVVDAKLHERDYVNKQMFVAEQSGSDVAANPTDIPAAPMPRLTQNQFPPSLSSNAPLTFAGLPPQIENSKVSRSRQLSNPPNSHFGLGLFPNLPVLGRKVEAFAKRTVPIPSGALTFSAMESRNPNLAREDEMQNVDGADAKEKAQADLDQSSAFSRRALAANGISDMNVTPPRSALAWKIAGGKLLKSSDGASWVDGYTGENLEFSVVTTQGSNIWAGGANAALVHSMNGGASWERITLGASATGSITGIEAAGSNVHVKSSSGQEWSSQDGGRTWSLDR